MKKIAVIEDAPDLHELLLHTLNQSGYSGTGLKTGEGALTFLRNQKPDLLLLDVLLPQLRRRQ